VYARTYTNGLVLVNPTDKPQKIVFQKIGYRAVPHRGGMVPADGDISDWTVEYVPVTEIVLAPNRAAILLVEPP
jgi:hypothetical protein